MKRLSQFALAALLLFGGVGTLVVPSHVTYAQEEGDISPMLIDFVAHSPAFIEWLAGYNDYNANAWIEYDDVWKIEFYDESWDEWLGYALIDSKTGEIIEAFVPLPLPQDVFERQQARIEVLLFDDPEINALIVDRLLWEYWFDYNRYDQVWEAYFYRGVAAWTIVMSFDEEIGGFSIEEIYDPNELDEEAAIADSRDQAIELAYNANGIDAALDGFDDWQTYVENQGGAVWSVTFVSGDEELFYALVDIASEQILESAVS